ncbi:MAG TPA: RT0821/Lpp0805 family surface protein [Geminicoccaceae bacterium]|nr:RT0821/Lpp0805 family surface protein [Geminicoccaceae bacterium]
MTTTTRTLALVGALALALAACTTATPPSEAPSPYARLSEHDIVLAAAALQRTLETAPDGQSRGWRNAESGSAGRITPTRTYLSDGGYFCRDYREELTVTGGETGAFDHRACRDDAGRWLWL